jgi:hypothetical protein
MYSLDENFERTKIFTPTTYEKGFLLFSQVPIKMGQPNLLLESLLGILLFGVKRPRLSPPNSAQIKNVWSHFSSFPYAFMTSTILAFYCVIHVIRISKIRAQIWVNSSCLLSSLSECKWGKFKYFGCSSPHKASKCTKLDLSVV